MTSKEVRAQVEAGLALHASDREASWDKLASPLRTALHAVAKDPELATDDALIDWLWKLAGSTAASRRALAHDRALPQAIYLRLATDRDGKTRQELGENPAIGAVVVEALAADPEPYIRFRAARHPAATTELLATLARDSYEGSRDGVAGHPNTDPKTLASLAGDTYPRMLQALGANPNTPPAVLDALARAPETRWAADPSTREWTLVALASNPATPPDTLAHLATAIFDWRGQCELAANPRTPAAALIALHDKVAKERIAEYVEVALAGNPAFPDERRQLLLASKRDKVRHSAAAGLADPKRVAVLASDKDPAIRAGIAVNPRTTAATLAKLATDPDERVRYNVVIDERVRGKHTNSISDESYALRGAACRVGPDLLGALAKDPSLLVRLWLTENPNTPPDAVARLSKDPEAAVRRMAAFHPAIPLDALVAMLGDADAEVRDCALRNARMPAGAGDALMRKAEARMLKSVAGGKGSAGTLARNRLASPRLLGMLAAKHASDLADSPNLYLEDVIAMPKSKGTKKPAKPAAKAQAKPAPIKSKTWKPSGKPGPVAPLPKKKGKVPRFTVTFKESKKHDPVDRAGGLPSAWPGRELFPWPECTQCLKPMTFVLQLVGTAAGGKVDLGNAAALQVFACNSNEGCCADEPGPKSGTNASVLRPHELGLEPAELPDDFPCELEPNLVMKLAPDYEDARLADETWRDKDEEAYEKAWSHANTQKIGGVATYGNEPSTVKCPKCKAQLEFLGKFWSAFQPFGSGTAYLYICPERHVVSYQAVN